MSIETVPQVETAPPQVVYETPFKVRTRRLWSTTKDVFSRGSTRVGAVIIFVLIGMAIFAPLLVPENPRGAYQMPRDLSSVAVPPVQRAIHWAPHASAATFSTESSGAHGSHSYFRCLSSPEPSSSG